MARKTEEEETFPSYWGGHVRVEGNIAGEIRDISREKDGSAVSFSMAVNDQNSRGDQGTLWFDVVARGSFAENLVAAADSADKSLRVIVDGRLEDGSWENKDGELIPKNRIRADSIGLSLRWSAFEAIEESKSSRTKAKSRRRDEDDEDDDDDEEEDEAPRRSRTRSSSSSRSGRGSRDRGERSGRGRARTRGDDDDDDFED